MRTTVGGWEGKSGGIIATLFFFVLKSILFSFFGALSCGGVGCLRIYGANNPDKGGGDDLSRKNADGNVIVGSVLLAAAALFAAEFFFRLYNTGKTADCVFHPFVACQPAGLVLTGQMVRKWRGREEEEDQEEEEGEEGKEGKEEEEGN